MNSVCEIFENYLIGEVVLHLTILFLQAIDLLIYYSQAAQCTIEIFYCNTLTEQWSLIDTRRAKEDFFCMFCLK